MSARPKQSNWRGNWHCRSSLRKLWGVGWLGVWAFPISGIAGQILKAFRQGSLTAQEARNKLLELLQAGRMNRKIYEALLAVIP